MTSAHTRRIALGCLLASCLLVGVHAPAATVDSFDVAITLVNDTPFTLKLVNSCITHQKQPITSSSIRFSHDFATRILPPDDTIDFAIAIMELGALQDTAAEGMLTFHVKETGDAFYAYYRFSRHSVCDTPQLSLLQPGTLTPHPGFFVSAFNLCWVIDKETTGRWTPGTQSRQEATVIFSLAGRHTEL